MKKIDFWSQNDRELFTYAMENGKKEGTGYYIAHNVYRQFYATPKGIVFIDETMVGGDENCVTDDEVIVSCGWEEIF